MKCVEKGHVYRLDNFQTGRVQEVIFMKRVDGEVARDGTTNEEVLTMLIERIRYLDTEMPCRENQIALVRLEEALLWLNRRTELRISQGVETSDKSHTS